jgi:hypothetical protein
MKEGRGFAFLLKMKKIAPWKKIVFAAYSFCMVTLYILCANYL